MREYCWTGAIALALAAMPALAQAQTAEPGRAQIQSYRADFFESARPATAMDMVDRLPGFDFDGGSDSRGFSGNSGNVLINGQRPTSKTESLRDVLSRIVAGDVDHIEVIHGSAPGIDMQGKSVIANVVRTQTPSTNIVAIAGTHVFTGSGRALPEGQLQYSRTVGERSYDLSIRRDARYNGDMGEANITRLDAAGHGETIEENRRGSGGNVAVNGTVSLPLAGGDFGANATAEQREFASGTIYDYAAGPQNYASTSRDQNGEVGASYQLEIGESTFNLEALQRLGHAVSTQILDDSGIEERFSSLQDTGESIARLTVRHALTEALTVEGGGETAYNFLSGRSLYTEDGTAVALPSSEVAVDEKRGEAFAQANWQALDDVALEAGVRAEYSILTQRSSGESSRAFFYPKPRALLSWSPDADSELRLRIEHKLGQLDFGDFISSASLTQDNVTAGNPDLRPDQRWQYELTYERHFWDRGAVTLSLLHQEIDDILDNKPLITPDGIYTVRGNIGSGTSNRISLDTTLPTDGLGIAGGLLSLSGSWRDSALTDPVTGQTRRFAGENLYSYSVDFSQDLEDWHSTWSLSLSDGYKQFGYRLSQLDLRTGAPSLDASWSYKPSADLNLTLRINNLIKAGRRRDSRYYTGLRHTAPLDRREIENTFVRPHIAFSVRKSFS